MFSFLSPLFLVGAAAAAIPIAIHLFYRRTEPVIDFAAMRYLRQAPVEHARRRRLREMLLLALRVAALVLLALAFARPYLASAAASGAGVTLVLVDRSASLSAAGQFDRARARAEQVIRDAPATDAVGVMTFASGVDLVAPVSQDRAGALAALAQLRAGAGSTRYRAALRRAADEIGDRAGRIVVVTDLQQSGWDATDEGGIPERVQVVIEDIGGPATNLAVTALGVQGSEAVAVVRSFAPAPVTSDVIISIDGRQIARVPVSVTSGSTAEARVSLEGRAPGALSASIADADGYAADNTRFAVMDAGAPVVLVITASRNPSEALYLERAIGLVEGVAGFRFQAVSGERLATLAPETVTSAGAIVVMGTRGLDQRGRERLAQFVRAGGGLLLTTAAEVDGAVVGQALSGVVATSWTTPSTAVSATTEAPLTFAPEDSRHPIFRAFGGLGTFGTVVFTRTALVSPGASAEVIARFSNGTPALVEERAASGRVLFFASDLNNRWNDFPLQPAFVPFVHETLRYLTARTARAEYLVGDLPGLEPGVHSMNNGARVAVNVDPRESDPARMDASVFSSGVSRLNAVAAEDARASQAQTEDTQSLWQYGLLLMVVSLAAEGVLGRRMG